MGVLTLLKHLHPCLEETHVEAYRGKTVAIDGNTFLFRGCYSCSEQVATGQPCSAPVDYLLKRIKMLQHFGVRPWVVLDGRRTPMKDETNKQRREEREKNLRMAESLRRQAESSAGSEKESLLLKAVSFFQKSIHVTRQMVTNTMAALKRQGVLCMVAPYEADAQVAFLVKSGLASAVITEDSDILVYMAAVKSTAQVLYKMDEFGACKALGFDPNKISALPGTIGKFGRGLSAFTGEGGGRLFVQLAALAGCDYVDNIRGLGLLSALPIITRFKTVPADRRIKRVLMHLQKMGKTIPEGHRERMLHAELSFFWHRCYDPRTKKCVHFCDTVADLIGTEDVPALASAGSDTAFLGDHIEDEMVVRIAQGEVDPATGEPVEAQTCSRLARGTVRRSVTLPSAGHSQSKDRRSASAGFTRANSSTVPMRTPLGECNRYNVAARNDRVDPPPHRKSQKAPQKRDKENTKIEAGRGLLREMFERARSTSSGKENMAGGGRPAGSHDISEVLMSCLPGKSTQPTRGAMSSEEAQPTAIRNPFAKRKAPGAIAAVEFVTPAPTQRGTFFEDKESPAEASCEVDAWSRLSSVSLVGERDDGVDNAEPSLDTRRCARRQSTSGGRNEGADAVAMVADEEVEIVGTKRAPLPTPPRGARSGPGKIKGAKRPRSAGKAVTMLSFFGPGAMAAKPR